MTFPLVLYRALSALALPFAARRQHRRITEAGFSEARARERLGHASVARPDGRLIWLHGASVGEAQSVLALSGRLAAQGVRVLLTSGTASSAQVIAGRLPQGVIHQFSPLDGRAAVRRFLDHWRPDLAVLVESELWPNLLLGCAARDVPVALLNARLSERSAARWARLPGTARRLLSGVVMAHCQDARTRDHLRQLGVAQAETGVNLKSVQPSPEVSNSELQTLRNSIGERPLWVAASTHAGEDEAVLAAHETLLRTYPELLLILMPRHPERRAEITALIGKNGLQYATRSTGDLPDAEAQVYLADTLGESALWYTLSPIVFLGGSLVQVGGHTPFEPAAAGCAIVHGPHYDNFAEVYAAFHAANASDEITSATSLAETITALLTDPARRSARAEAAKTLVDANTGALDDIAHALLKLSSPS